MQDCSLSGTDIAGLATVAVGLAMMLGGLLVALRKARRDGELGASDFVSSVAELVGALSGQNTSLVLFSFGTVMVFLGGLLLGVAGVA
jgi:hypothetical protein